ncbi:MAG: glucose-1-phosphate thymidylyltransferase [Bacteroidetes bacterium]|nr:MAG: glucose-1-phosphate thymidylyltransferase [Bacteroidota bacterium]
MNYILFDDKTWDNFLPLTFTRPVAEIRIGILTIKEKWEKYFNQECSYYTQDYLQKKYKAKYSDDNIFLNASILPKEDLVSEIISLKVNCALMKNDVLIAVRFSEKLSGDFMQVQDYVEEKKLSIVNCVSDFVKINYSWDIFSLNEQAIKSDFQLITNGRKSQPISKTNNVLGKENIFIEQGAKIEFATINAQTGFVYIGKDAEVMEGAVIRGPFVLCEHSVVKMSAKIYGPSTIGPHSKFGGEINNVVVFGYSNKAHDGFLGNAVIGEWCNIGADSNNSNLKNNYASVKLWDYKTKHFTDTGLQFCGLIMGDHSKCGINTMFNTGTIVGVSANIFGSGFQRNFVPSFAWGGTRGFTVYRLNKVFEVVEKVMMRRNIKINDTDKAILSHIFNITEQYRNFK